MSEVIILQLSMDQLKSIVNDAIADVVDNAIEKYKELPSMTVHLSVSQRCVNI